MSMVTVRLNQRPVDRFIIDLAICYFIVNIFLILGGGCFMVLVDDMDYVTGMSSVIDHALSMAVFVIFLVEFLVVKGCGTSTFFILGLMSLVDVIAGFTVSIAGARRDFTYGGQVH